MLTVVIITPIVRVKPPDIPSFLTFRENPVKHPEKGCEYLCVVKSSFAET